jgi:hypothetical protein
MSQVLSLIENDQVEFVFDAYIPQKVGDEFSVCLCTLPFRKCGVFILFKRCILSKLLLLTLPLLLTGA